MRLVKIGVGAVSVKVADFSGNADRITSVIREAQDQGVHLLVMPELCISGYSLKDRVWWPDIARRSWDTLCEIAEECKDISVFLGLPIELDSLMYNAVAMVHDGEIVGLITKQNLPQYNIFYEGRNWTAGDNDSGEYYGVPVGNLVFDLPYGRVSAEICEDLWAANSPAPARARVGAEIICNSSASPFTPLKNISRKRVVQAAAGRMSCVYVLSNMLGLDSDRLVFDGSGLITTPDGLVTDAPLLSPEPWTLNTGIVDLDQVSRHRVENTSWRDEGSFFSEDEVPMIVEPIEGGGMCRHRWQNMPHNCRRVSLRRNRQLPKTKRMCIWMNCMRPWCWACVIILKRSAYLNVS